MRAIPAQVSSRFNPLDGVASLRCRAIRDRGSPRLQTGCGGRQTGTALGVERGEVTLITLGDHVLDALRTRCLGQHAEVRQPVYRPVQSAATRRAVVDQLSQDRALRQVAAHHRHRATVALVGKEFDGPVAATHKILIPEVRSRIT